MNCIERYCQKHQCSVLELFCKVFEDQSAIRASLELYTEDGIIPYAVRDYIRENS